MDLDQGLPRQRKRRRIVSSSEDEGEADVVKPAQAGTEPANIASKVDPAAADPGPKPAEDEPLVQASTATSGKPPETHKAEPPVRAAAQPQEPAEAGPQALSEEERPVSGSQAIRARAARTGPKPKPKAKRARSAPTPVAQEALAEPPVEAEAAANAATQSDEVAPPPMQDATQAEPADTATKPAAAAAAPQSPRQSAPKKSHDVVKALRAAKRFLTASCRADDPVMRARSEVLSELSIQEATAFAEASACRRKGEWSFEVLAPKVEARLREQGIAPPERSGADAAAGPEPVSVPTPVEDPVKDAKEAFATEAKESSTGGSEATLAQAAFDAPAAAKAPLGPPNAARAHGRGRGSRTRPRPSIPKAFQVGREAEVVQGPPVPEGNRRFTPIRPGTRTLGPLVPKVAPERGVNGGAAVAAALEVPKPRARCVHKNEIRTGPYLICADCGEELQFDAWRMELVDDLDMPMA